MQAYREQQKELEDIGRKLLGLSFQTAREQEVATEIVDRTLGYREKALKRQIEEQQKEIERLNQLNSDLKQLAHAQKQGWL